MRIFLTAVAAFALGACERPANVTDDTSLVSNSLQQEEEAACAYVDELSAALGSARNTYSADHPDIRRLKSIILDQLTNCRFPGKSLVQTDKAPPNSTAFEFNGLTYYVVPLDDTADLAQASR